MLTFFLRNVQVRKHALMIPKGIVIDIAQGFIIIRSASSKDTSDAGGVVLHVGRGMVIDVAVILVELLVVLFLEHTLRLIPTFFL